jgi:hypothetical protein
MHYWLPQSCRMWLSKIWPSGVRFVRADDLGGGFLGEAGYLLWAILNSVFLSFSIRVWTSTSKVSLWRMVLSTMSLLFHSELSSASKLIFVRYMSFFSFSTTKSLNSTLMMSEPVPSSSWDLGCGPSTQTWPVIAPTALSF